MNEIRSCVVQFLPRLSGLLFKPAGGSMDPDLMAQLWTQRIKGRVEPTSSVRRVCGALRNGPQKTLVEPVPEFYIDYYE